MLRWIKNLFASKSATNPAVDPAEIARHVAAAMTATQTIPAPALDPTALAVLIADAAKTAVAEALAAQQDGVSPEPEPAPLEQLAAQARECAELLDLDEDGEQFSPEEVARAVAIVLPLLGRLHGHLHDFVAAHWPTRGAAFAEAVTEHLELAGEQAAVVAGWISCRPAEISEVQGGDPI